MFSVVLAGVTLACIVCAAEVFLRMTVSHATIPDWFTLHPRYGYVHRANYEQEYRYAHTNVTWVAKLNSLGLRDKEYDLERDNVTRILLLGDSYTFGYGLNAELIFDARLEKLLNDGEHEYQVINAGHAGWGTIQEATYAIDHFDLYKPDIIVLTYCENDQNDDRMHLQGASSGLLPSFPGKRFLRMHSYLYRSIYELLQRPLFTRLAEREDMRRVSDEPPAHIAPEQPTNKTVQVNTVLVDAADAAWEQTLASISRLRDAYRAFNPEGVIIIQATDPLHQGTRQRFLEFEDEETIYYADLLMEANALTYHGMLLPYERHWSEDMHDGSARVLYDTIKSLEPLEKGP